MKIMLLGCLNTGKGGNQYGGAEKTLIQLANWLAKNSSHQVFLCSVEGKTLAYPLDPGVSFIAYDIKAGNKLQVHLQIFRNTGDALRRVKPDILIGFWIHPLFYASLLDPLNRVPKIYSERNDPRLEYGFMSRLLRAHVLRKAARIIFQTNNAKAYFCRSVQNKSCVIHNPVYISQDDYGTPCFGSKRIVSVGRLSHQKNHALLIQAFSRLLEDHPAYKLEIYGDGPLRSQLEEMLRDMGLTHAVFLRGTYPDILDKIHGADLFVLPSKYEGMPNALMEAMALGIPVISSDCPCGGPGELIKSGENGYLFPCGSVDALYELLVKVLEMGECEIRAISKKEREICLSHSQAVIFREWLRVIMEIHEESSRIGQASHKADRHS